MHEAALPGSKSENVGNLAPCRAHIWRSRRRTVRFRGTHAFFGTGELSQNHGRLLERLHSPCVGPPVNGLPDIQSSVPADSRTKYMSLSGRHPGMWMSSISSGSSDVTKACLVPGGRRRKSPGLMAKEEPSRMAVAVPDRTK